MPPKPQSKDLEDLLQAIQDRLTTMQTQMEATEARQTNLEAHNDLLQSFFAMFQDHVSTLPPPQSSPFTSSHEPPHNVTPPLPSLKPPKIQLTFF